MSHLQVFNNVVVPSQNLWSSPHQSGQYYTVENNGQRYSFQAAESQKKRLEPLFGPLKNPSEKQQFISSPSRGYMNQSNPISLQQSDLRLSTFGTISNSPDKSPQYLNATSPQAARKLGNILNSPQLSGANARYIDYSPNTKQHTLAESASNSAQKQSQYPSTNHQNFMQHENVMNNQQIQLNQLYESPFQSMALSKQTIGNSLNANIGVTHETKPQTSISRVGREFHSPQTQQQSSAYFDQQKDSFKETQAQIDSLSNSVKERMNQIVNNHYNQFQDRKHGQLETQSERINPRKTKSSVADEAYRNWRPLFQDAGSKLQDPQNEYSQPYELRQSTEPLSSYHQVNQQFQQSRSNNGNVDPPKNQLSPSSDYAFTDTQRIINKWNSKQRHQSESLHHNNYNQQDQFFESVKSFRSNEFQHKNPPLFPEQVPQKRMNFQEQVGKNYHQHPQQFLEQQQQYSADNQKYPTLNPFQQYAQEDKIDHFSDQKNYQNDDQSDYYTQRENQNGQHPQSDRHQEQQQDQNYDQNDDFNQDNHEKDETENIDENQSDLNQYQPHDLQQNQLFESEQLFQQQQPKVFNNLNQQQLQSEVFQSLSHNPDNFTDLNSSDSLQILRNRSASNTPTNDFVSQKEMSIKSILNLPSTLKLIKSEREPKKLLKNQTTLTVQIVGVILLFSFLYVLLIL